MYKISNGIKIFSLTLILLGGIGWGYSYMDSHKTIEQVKEMLMNESSHGSSHGDQSEHMEKTNEDHHKFHEICQIGGLILNYINNSAYVVPAMKF